MLRTTVTTLLTVAALLTWLIAALLTTVSALLTITALLTWLIALLLVVVLLRAFSLVLLGCAFSLWGTLLISVVGSVRGSRTLVTCTLIVRTLVIVRTRLIATLLVAAFLIERRTWLIASLTEIRIIAVSWLVTSGTITVLTLVGCCFRTEAALCFTDTTTTLRLLFSTLLFWGFS